MKFSAVDGKTLQYKEPARNEGYQMAHLKDVKRKEGNESDIEYVTKFKVIGVDSNKENLTHTGRLEETRLQSDRTSWIPGRFPSTSHHISLDKNQRTVTSIVQHFYPFMVKTKTSVTRLVLKSHSYVQPGTFIMFSTENIVYKRYIVMPILSYFQNIV